MTGGPGQRQVADLDDVGRVLGAVAVTGRLRFGDAVVLSDHQAGELVRAIGVGLQHDLCRIVTGAEDAVGTGAGQRDGDALQAAIRTRIDRARIAGIEIAVAVAVHVDATADARHRVFAEVEQRAVGTGAQVDGADAVGGGGIAAHAAPRRAAGGTGHATDQAGIHRRRTVLVAAGRQYLAQRVDGQRIEVGEAVSAAGIGRGGGHDGAGGGIEQFDGGAGDGAVAPIAHVAEVGVDVDEAGQRWLAYLGEVVAHAGLVGADGNRADHRVGRPRRIRATERRRTATGRGRIDRTVDVTGRLGLGDGVARRIGGRQVLEAVRTVRRGRQGEVHRVAVEVGTGQHDGDAGDAGFARDGLLRAAVPCRAIAVFEHQAFQRRTRD